MKALITRKIGMTSTIAEDGVMQAVTLLSAAQNTVTQIKNTETDGYMAVQLGAEEQKKMGKAQAGHFKLSKVQPKLAREIRITDQPEDLSVGSQLAADVFSVGDKVNVTATSKGSYRRPGSIGSMYPQKIFKGKKMAGQMGDEQVTVRNLTIALVDMEHNVIGVTGAVPGPRKGIVVIKGDA
jgi:large subunit ribosomal protein L3